MRSLIVVVGLMHAMLTPASSPAARLPLDQHTASPIAGTWLGTLTVQAGAKLRIVFHIETDDAGALSATMDSPDQGATGIAVDEVAFDGETVRLTLPAIRGAYEGSLQPDGDHLQGTWSQGGASLPLDLERVDKVEAAPRPQEPKPPLPYASEEVRFPNPQAGIELAGTVTIPKGEGQFPAAVLLTGSGPQDRDETVFGHRPFLVLADHLARLGIAALRFDDRGVGESGGTFQGATTEDFATDALAAVAYLRARPEVNAGRVGLIGHSEGGLVAPLAATRSDSIAYVVLLAGPGLPGESILYLQGEALLRANGASDEVIAVQRRVQEGMFAIVREEEDPEARATRLRAYLETRAAELTPQQRVAAGIPEDAKGWMAAQAKEAGSEWFRFFLTYDPRPALRRLRVPVLALGGGLDLQVPAAENLPAVDAALREGGDADITVRELGGLNHLFQHAKTGLPDEYGRIEETFAPDAMQTISDWILVRFGTRGR